jgi:hypothetical protein
MIKEAIMSKDLNLCPQECQTMNNYYQEVSTYIISVPCSEVESINVNYFMAKAQEIRQKHQSQVENCLTCINAKKDNESRNPSPENDTSGIPMQLKSAKSPKPVPAYRPPIIDMAEQLNTLANTMSIAQNEIMANSREKQNKLNEIDSRDLSNKVNLQPNIPDETYNKEKNGMEKNIFGETNTDKYSNSLGGQEIKSLDELLNKLNQKPKYADSTCKINSLVSKDDVYQGININSDNTSLVFFKLGYQDGFYGTNSVSSIVLFGLTQEDPATSRSYIRGKSIGRKDKVSGAEDFFSGKY